MKPAQSSGGGRGERDPRRHGRVLAELRRRIVQGQFKPGARLPRRQELIEELGASSLTLQRAMDRLAQEEFIVARPRHGTFVADHPPHLFRYGLIFSSTPEQGYRWGQSRFWTALAHEAQHLDPAGVRRVSIYTGVTEHADSEAAHQLRADLALRRVSGLIIAQPYGLSEVLAACPVPCVSFLRQPDLPSVLTIQIDRQQVFERALERLASLGRQRIGLVCSHSMSTEALRLFAGAIAKRGMRTQPAWIQGIHLPDPHWASNAVQAMMQGQAAQAPDGLIVSDDHLVEHVEHGLLASGVQVPKQVSLIGYTNFGWSPEPILPIERLGYVPRELLGLAVELIDQQNRKRSAPRVTVVQPRFEHELDAPPLPTAGAP